MKKRKLWDGRPLIGTVAVLLFAVIPMMAFPKTSEDIITGNLQNSAISDLIGSSIFIYGAGDFLLRNVYRICNSMVR